MRVVIAPDSFKESMTSREAGEAIARGIRKVIADAECVVVPMSDGGEGFTESIANALGADLVHVPTHDALGRPHDATVAVAAHAPAPGSDPVAVSAAATTLAEITDLPTAVLEVASAVGLADIKADERDPLRASSRGVGEMVAYALDRVGPGGRIIVGLGGSATNDAGAGMLAALGARFVDADGVSVDPIPANVGRIDAADFSNLDTRLGSVRFEIASDVTNPLLGDSGASAVFGPQKGADASTVRALDRALEDLVRVCERSAPELGVQACADQEGAGAAGGLGWAFATFTNARFERGVDVVTREVGLCDLVACGTDLVVTGEGSIDAQTLNGKAPAGVAAIAKRHGVPCVVFAGRVLPDADVLYSEGVTALVPIMQGASSLDSALADGVANIERAAEMVVRLLRTRLDS